MAVLGRLAIAAALIGAAACYSPQINECSIECGAGASCPSGTTCLADNFCHGSQSTLCGALPDSPIGTPDGRPDARLGTPDAPSGGPDARRADAPIGTPDAPAPTPDAPAPTPDAPTNCVPILEPVDTTGAPQMGDISIDSSGGLHATYVRSDTNELWYARKPVGGDWNLEMVDDATPVKKGQFIDPFNGIHVAYSFTDRGTTTLRYAHRAPDTGTWTTTDVTSDGDPIDASIVVDALGTVHIAYYDNDFGVLDHASRSLVASDWSFETIDDLGDVGEFPSLAISPTTQRLFVSYHDVSLDELKLAQRINGSWMADTLDMSLNVGSYTALAIDSLGNLHIAYANDNVGSLRYILIDHNGGAPLRLPADTNKTGHWNAIGVDPRGGVHISTYAYGTSDLHLAFRPGPTGSFATTPVDTEGAVGRFTGIAVDGQGGAHIVYTDDTHDELKHAFVCPPPSTP